MFRIFRTNSRKGDKKKKGSKANNTKQSNEHLNEGVNLKSDKSVENTDIEGQKNTARKDSIPIGIKWITQPSTHGTQDQSNSTNSNNDGIDENSSTPSRVSQLTENSDRNIKDKDSSSFKSSNITSETESLLSNDKSNRNSTLSNNKSNRNSILSNNKSNRNSINCEKISNDNVNEENVCNNVEVQVPLQDEINTNTDIIKQEDNESLHKSTMLHHQNHNESDNIVSNTHDILELLLAKFNKFEENIMVEINYIKESQEKQEKRLQEIQIRQEEVTTTLNKIVSEQFPSTDKEIEIEESVSESEKEYPDSIPGEITKITSSNNLPTIQEADINVEQHKTDLTETDLQSPSISSSLMTSTVSSTVTTHNSEQFQSQQASVTSPDTLSGLTDENVSTLETLSKSLPNPSPGTPSALSSSLPGAQHKVLSTIAVHNSMSKLEHFNSPVTSRNAPVVPSPFRSSNPPIKHSPPTKPKRLSLQIPMSSSPCQESEEIVSCPLRRSIEWPEHSPFTEHKTNVSSKSLRKVQDRDMRMFITITP